MNLSREKYLSYGSIFIISGVLSLYCMSLEKKIHRKTNVWNGTHYNRINTPERTYILHPNNSRINMPNMTQTLHRNSKGKIRQKSYRNFAFNQQHDKYTERKDAKESSNEFNPKHSKYQRHSASPFTLYCRIGYKNNNHTLPIDYKPILPLSREQLFIHYKPKDNSLLRLFLIRSPTIEDHSTCKDTETRASI